MKKVKILSVLVLVILALFSSTNISAQDWKKIVPLSSKCEDIKKILKVKECKYPVSDYEFPKFVININFSTADDEWNVSKDTVTGVIIILRELIKLKDFETNFDDYEITPEYDLPDVKIYKNDKKGIAFSVQKFPDNEEYISDFRLFPSRMKKKRNLK